MRRCPAAILSAALLTLIPSGPSAAGEDPASHDPNGPGATGPSHFEQKERPEMPPAEPAPRDDGEGGQPRTVVQFGPYVSIQVNVNSAGNNIPGDAANEPSIAVDPNNPNRMVIGWRQFNSVNSNFRQSGYGYSHNGGQTWTFPGVLEPGVFSSDPVLACDRNGHFYYYALQPDRGPGDWACYMYKTFDGGVTWPQEVYAYGGDKQWFTVDRTTGPGSGFLYASWVSSFSCCGEMIFTRSTNGGLTWMTPITVPGLPRHGTLTVGPAGELYICGTNFVVVKSTNANNAAVTPTFGNPVTVSMGGVEASGGVNPAGLLGQAYVAAAPSGSNVYLLASVDPPGSDPCDVRFARSTNGGTNFGTSIRINDVQAGYQWFGMMSVAPNGRIDAVWNDTRHFPANNMSELYYSYSTDGGQSWAANIQVSPAFNHSLGYPQQNKLGDYYDLVSDNFGVHVAYAATFNGEQDVYYLRIGPSDCNQNGIADDVDIANGTSEDCDGNGRPDECEDCNNNDVGDACDIEAGTSDDCNGDVVPDECQADLCAPTPNPMAFSIPPTTLNTSQIMMQAVEATDERTPPARYYFDFVGGASGGPDSGWQTSRDFVATIDPFFNPSPANSGFNYRVRAGDSSPNINPTQDSPVLIGATAIQTPTGVSFGAVTDTSIIVQADGTFNNLTLGQSGIYFEMTPAAGSGANQWVQTTSVTVTGLTPGTSYTFRAKARNFQGFETPYTAPAAQSTTGPACPLPGDVNGDSALNGLDVAGFVRVKLGSPLPGDVAACADFGTGDVLLDTAAFIAALLGA